MKLKIAAFLSGLYKRERIVFYGSVLFVSLALLDRLILSPILHKVFRLDEDINQQIETIKRNLAIVSQESILGDEINKYASYLSHPESEEKEITAFSKEIENLAKESAVYLVGLRPAGKGEEGISKQYFLELDFEAQMEQILNFFYAIENSNKLTKIERFDIMPKAEGTSITSCRIRVSKVIIPKLNTENTAKNNK